MDQWIKEYVRRLSDGKQSRAVRRARYTFYICNSKYTNHWMEYPGTSSRPWGGPGEVRQPAWLRAGSEDTSIKTPVSRLLMLFVWGGYDYYTKMSQLVDAYVSIINR